MPAAQQLSSGPRVAPAPPRVPLFGHLLAAKKDFLGLLQRAADCGDVARLDLVERVYLVVRPDLVKRVLQDNHLNYRKGFGYEHMMPLLGNGLLTSENDFWRRQRRLAQPAFHRQRIGAFADLMVRHASQMLEQWEAHAAAGEAVDVQAEMTRLALTVVGDALFGVNLNGDAADVGQALGTALQIIETRLRQPFVFPPWVPTPENRRFARAVGTLDALVSRIIGSRRRGGGGEHSDLLGMLMDARDEDGSGMTDSQLRDEVMTMLLAGHETTANALTWWLVLMAGHPEQAQRQADEALAVLGGRPPTLADVPNLPFTTRCVEEAMRLYPPAFVITRRALQDDELDGVRIRAGSTVLLSPYVTHRSPRVWEDPERFDPDRFLPERSAGRPSLSYFPFAAGPRQCIGNSFALLELQLVCAAIGQRFAVELLNPQEVAPEPQITLRPKGPVRVRLHHRQGLPKVAVARSA